MKTKLEAIEGIETAGEKKIWDYIETIFQTSNPNYIRRQDCLTLRQKKGETTSEFSDWLKREFIESDMVNATIWSIYQHKVVDSLDHDNSDEKELKTKLLLELKKKPNPNEKDCDEFIRIIREHEAVMNSRGYREEGRKIKLLALDEEKKTDLPRPPHALCGLVHGKRECKFKCPECGKPHSADQCYVLHPKLAPPGWRTPDKSRGRRDRERNDRGRRNQRSQTRSVERRGDRSNDRRGEPSKYDKRDKSPRSSREKIQKVDKRDRKSETEDDSDQERKDLERRLEKLKDKKNPRTNRIRREMFEDEDSYINLEREFNNTRSSRDRNVRI